MIIFLEMKLFHSLRYAPRGTNNSLRFFGMSIFFSEFFNTLQGEGLCLKIKPNESLEMKQAPGLNLRGQINFLLDSTSKI